MYQVQGNSSIPVVVVTTALVFLQEEPTRTQCVLDVDGEKGRFTMSNTHIKAVANTAVVVVSKRHGRSLLPRRCTTPGVGFVFGLRSFLWPDRWC